MTDFSRLICFFVDKKIKSKDRKLLMEAYRRKMMFHRDKSLEGTWLGLGTASRYKSDYFTTTDGKPTSPRCNDWWVLTDLGVQTLTELIELAPFPEKQDEIDNLNLILFQQ